MSARKSLQSSSAISKHCLADRARPSARTAERLLRLALVAVVLLAWPRGAGAAEEVFDATGYSPLRTPFSQLPYEHIDPLTGNVMLTFTDLVLPGNAGFDLKIQRTYNSKIRKGYDSNVVQVDDSWAGLGWTMHFGRVLNPFGDSAVIEMPDGSRHETYLPRTGVSPYFTGSDRITKSYWRYRKNGANYANPATLELPNGLKYTFKHVKNGLLYATKIEDPYGNLIEISYMQPSIGNPIQSGDTECSASAAASSFDSICRVIQHIGGGQNPRVVKFTASAFHPPSGPPHPVGLSAVASMIYDPSDGPPSTWTYTHETAAGIWSGGYSLLKKVVPPTGGLGWTFGYDETTSTGELNSVRTPNGGYINYTYEPKTYYVGPLEHFTSRAVVSRTAVLRDGVTMDGTWTYKYPEDMQAIGGTNSQSQIISPCGVKTVYHFHVGTPSTTPPFGSGTQYAVGRMMARQVLIGSETVEWEEYPNVVGEPISDQPYQFGDPLLGYTDGKSWIALPSETKLHRGEGASAFYISHSYGTANFNDFGRPTTTDEGQNGGYGRRTTRVFAPYNYFTKFIADRTISETLAPEPQTIPPSQSFTTTYSYRASDGFMEQQNVRGIITNFTSDRGNVQSATDANGHTTSYTYSWGVLKDVNTPVASASIAQSINEIGTVQWQRRGTGGSATYFDYDTLGRLRHIYPPEGHPTEFVYDDSGPAESWTKRRAGTSGPVNSVTTDLDSLGRPTKTTNAVGVKTETRYDHCGRVSYESYPYEGSLPAPAPGAANWIAHQYDDLDRLIQTTYPGTATNPTGPKVAISYYRPTPPYDTDNVSRWVTDEDGRITYYDYKAYGHPDRAYLRKVKDAHGKESTYTYDVIGNLTTVTPPGGATATRGWEYWPSGLLKREVHPEVAEILYTYKPAGQLLTRNDGRVKSTYTYDDNDRLTKVDYEGVTDGGHSDINIQYDTSGNRTYISNTLVGSEFHYDSASRLRWREDIFPDGPTLRTTYTPDDHDNVATIQYPSGTTIGYTYDNANRLTLVKRGTQTLADNFTYHPSGGVLSYRAGNNIVHTLGYDQRHRQNKYLASGVLSLELGLSGTGNVQSITDSRSGFSSGTSMPLQYDGLHRLTDVSGFGARAFTYDDLGNRTTQSVGNQTTTFFYNNAQQLWKAETEEPNQATVVENFFYNAVGSLKEDGSAHYAYTLREMLQRVIPKNGSPQVNYDYDGDNMRAFRLRGGERNYYVHGLGGALLAEHRRCGTGPYLPAREYIFAGSRLLAGIDYATKPVISFTSPSRSLTEAAPPQTQAVQVATWDQCPTLDPITVPYISTPILPGSTADYLAPAGTLTFAAGTSNLATLDIPFSIVNDTLVEATESFKLDLQAPTNAILGTPTTHTVTITDDDGTVRLTSTGTAVGEAGPSVTYFAERTNSNGYVSSNPMYVNFITSNGTANAGPPGTGDYISSAGQLTFASGMPSGQQLSMTIPINEDTVVECAETFTLALTNPVGGILGSPTTATTSITDNDVTRLSANDPVVTETNVNTTMTFQVAASQVPCGPVTVNYASQDITARSTNPYPDYVTTAGVLTFSGSSGNISVPIVGDTVHEDASQTLALNLSAPTNATILDAQGIGTIQNDDVPAQYSLVTPPPQNEPDEGTAPVSLTVTRTGNLSEPPVVVNYSNADGSATHVLGDYVQAAGTVTFAPFSTANSQFTMLIGGDSADEPEEFFHAQIGMQTAAYGSVGTGSVQVTINDDDPTVSTITELYHGLEVSGTATTAGTSYRLYQKPYSSYELILDGAIPGGNGFVQVSRFSGNGSTPNGTAVPTTAAGLSRSLRWMNDNCIGQCVGETGDTFKVEAMGCAGGCAGGPYRLRAFETTYTAARFNNASGQATVVTIQNTSSDNVTGRVNFWSDSGVLLTSVALALSPNSFVTTKGLFILNTATLPELANQSGSITVSNNGRYGVLVGKAVSIDPTTGVSYDTLLEPRK